MRITLDANILVRANTRAQGPARELLTLIGSRGPHTLVLSRHILSEVKRTLLYPRLQAQRVATIVEPFISEPVVRNDPQDDAVRFTAVQGRADVLCTRDRDFYLAEVIAFCRQRGIEVMNELQLLRRTVRLRPAVWRFLFGACSPNNSGRRRFPRTLESSPAPRRALAEGSKSVCCQGLLPASLQRFEAIESAYCDPVQRRGGVQRSSIVLDRRWCA